MRTRLLVRSAAVAAVALLGASACGGGSSQNADTNVKVITGSPTATSDAGVQAEVKANFTSFFDPNTTVEKKLTLLENGERFKAAAQGLANSPIAKQVSVDVTKVDVKDQTHATVTFDLLLNKTPTLKDQKADMVKQGGTWKLSDSALCSLLALQGAAPPPCPSTSPSSTTSPAG